MKTRQQPGICGVSFWRIKFDTVEPHVSTPSLFFNSITFKVPGNTEERQRCPLKITVISSKTTLKGKNPKFEISAQALIRGFTVLMT